MAPVSKLIVRHGVVECPVCDVRLLVVTEWDRRLAKMEHPPTAMCCFSQKKFRVDRINGDAEVLYEA